MKNQRSIAQVLCGALALFVALQGCGDDNDANPKPPKDVTPTAGKSSTSGSGGTAGNDTNEGGTGNSGNTGNTGEGGTPDPVGGAAGAGGAGPDEPKCDLPELGANDCFNCPKNGVVVQWLNRCVQSDCLPFDNSATRLPRIKADGTLPALPN